MQSTYQGRDGQSFYRKTAIAIGAIYLAGIPLGIGGNILLQSILGATDPLANGAANSGLVAIGALLWVLSGPVADAAHGILMFPIMNCHGGRVPYGYLGAGIMDAW